MNQLQLQQVIEEHGEHMLKIAYFIVKNRATAEDIVQDVFVQMLGQTNYEERGNLRAYLTKVTANRAKDHLRSWRYRMIQLLGEREPNTGVRHRDELLVDDERSELGEAILAMPLKYREPIILYYYEELPLVEIAAHLKLPVNTVKTHLRKARQLLQRSLHKGDWEVLFNESMEA